jgi:hypothetical protein
MTTVIVVDVMAAAAPVGIERLAAGRMPANATY